MNKLIFVFAVLVNTSLWASVKLMVGDILLQPLDCWSCRLIEEEEGSLYSHMGVVVAVKPQVIVAEALDNVRTLNLRSFNSRTKSGGKLSVRRFSEGSVVNYLQKNQSAFYRVYLEQFHGKKYDADFLWNNFDEHGNEKFYCSEMVTKLLKDFLDIDLPVKAMHYHQNRDEWIRFFKGTPPDGKPGNSPADFERSHLLYEVGEI